MKKLLILFGVLIVCFSLQLKSQDIITLKTGDEISAKVIEVGIDEIKYNRTDNLTGPVYIEKRANVFMIKYQNGTKDVFKDNIAKTDTATQPLQKKIELEYDILVLDNTTDTIHVTIKDVLPDKIYYYKLNDTTSLWAVKRSDLCKAYYKNGQKIIDNPYKAQVTNSKPEKTTAELYAQGQKDAFTYYDSYRGAVTGTILTSLLASSLIGLIPAIACASTPPKRDNLGIMDFNQFNNQAYYSGYSSAASKIKSRRVWGGWGVSVIVNVMAFSLYMFFHK